MKKDEENNVSEIDEMIKADTKQETKEVKEDKEPKEEKNQKTKKEDITAEELKAQLKSEKEKSEEYYDHLKRNMAEFDNFKKRISKEKDMMYNSVTANIISDILPVIDNFEKALNAETTDDTYKSGIQMIYNQLLEVLSKIGIEEIEALNQTFDPNFHEAVMHIEDENYAEKEVVEIFRKGYKIGDKIIRHAMVKVAN